MVICPALAFVIVATPTRITIVSRVVNRQFIGLMPLKISSIHTISLANLLHKTSPPPTVIFGVLNSLKCGLIWGKALTVVIKKQSPLLSAIQARLPQRY